MKILPVEAAALIPAYEVATMLADEGVPVRAIARATRIPGEDVYTILKDAIGEGKLIELPRDDWPPGSRRTQRVQPDHSILSHNDDALKMACSARFNLTRQQATVFVAILRRPEISKDQIHSALEAGRKHSDNPTDAKMVDVVVCNVRKRLKLIDPRIEIATLWGIGYSLKAEAKELTFQHLLQYFAPTAAAA